MSGTLDFEAGVRNQTKLEWFLAETHIKKGELTGMKLENRDR